MLPTWANDTVIRIRPTTKTSRGSVVPDWDNVDRLEIKHCSVQPASTGLSQDGRVLGTNEGVTAYLPYDADVIAGDHIEHDGDVYEINGKPRKWSSPTGRVSNMQLNLVRWQG